jgi:hypothetical protein
LRVGQDELRVVLSGHGLRLRPAHQVDCELFHNFHNDFLVRLLSY